MTGFGASPSPGSALLFLERATELKHPMAMLFAENLRRALGDEYESPEGERSCTDRIIQGFKNQTPEVRGIELRQVDAALGQKVERFKSFAAFKFWLDAVDEKDYEKMSRSYVITMPFMVRMDILSLAITMDDVSTVRKFAKILLQEKSVSSDDTALIQACRRGSTEIVHALLDAGADPETVTENGCSLYHWLFMLGDGARSVAKRLLESERNSRSDLLNHPCSRPYILHPQWPLELFGTPLAFAILSKSTTAVEALLDLGALPHAPINGFIEEASKISWTPIHLSVKFHQLDILRLLLARMSPTSPFLSADGTVEISTFELARCLSYSTMVERLVMHSKDIMHALVETLEELPTTALSSASNDGITPLMEAIDFSDLSVVKAMLQIAPKLALTRFIDPEDATLFTYPVIFAAQIAARRDSSLTLDIVKVLLSHMPKNHIVKDSEGRTPLHLSVTGYSTSTTKWLLENRYSPNICDNSGRTAIHQVTSTASLDILLAAGADIDCNDYAGFTCAHIAALRGLEDLVDALIYRSANLNCNSSLGTPLHCAVLAQSWRIAEALLRAKDGAGKSRIDVDAPDDNGDTALHLAFRTPGLANVVRLLLSHGASAYNRNKNGVIAVHGK
jgi:ankyrin repeat protein